MAFVALNGGMGGGSSNGNEPLTEDGVVTACVAWGGIDVEVAEALGFGDSLAMSGEGVEGGAGGLEPVVHGAVAKDGHGELFVMVTESTVAPPRFDEMKSISNVVALCTVRCEYPNA